MQTRKTTTVGLSAALVGLVLLASQPISTAQAQGKEDEDSPEVACIKNHERSQVQRLEGKLLEARAAARRCSAPECPTVIRTDCLEWFREIQQTLPTIIPLAQSDRGDEPNVKVYLDEQLLGEKLEGRPIELNPGPHELRFEHPDYPPIQTRLVVREGEKNRVVSVRFGKDPEPGQPGYVPPSTTPEPEVPMYRPVQPITFVLGGLAVAAAGAGTFFGLKARSERDRLEEACAPLCQEDDLKDLKRNALIADIGFGVAVVSAGAALITLLTRPSVPIPAEELEQQSEDPEADQSAKRKKSRPPEFSVAPSMNGVQFGLTGTF